MGLAANMQNAFLYLTGTSKEIKYHVAPIKIYH